MSHELRTPLNSLLILSDQLSKNRDGNLTRRADGVRQDDPLVGQRPADADQRHPRPVEDRVGHGDGRRRRAAASTTCSDYVERTFRHVAEAKSVEFSIGFDPALPPSMFTDAKRLQQIIKNLLSNAFKFTAPGPGDADDRAGRRAGGARTTRSSTGRGRCSRSRWRTPASASPPDKQQIIFEAFQQADG